MATNKPLHSYRERERERPRWKEEEKLQPGRKSAKRSKGEVFAAHCGK